MCKALTDEEIAKIQHDVGRHKVVNDGDTYISLAIEKLLGEVARLKSKSSIIQDWAAKLHLRCQGVLVSSIRGCDTVAKEHPTKDLARVYRSLVLVAAAKKPSSFIDFVDLRETERRMNAVLSDVDPLPHHYVMHMTHSAQIVGLRHSDEGVRHLWTWFYEQMCRGLHVTPETEERMMERLEGTEQEFAEDSKRKGYVPKRKNPYDYP